MRPPPNEPCSSCNPCGFPRAEGGAGDHAGPLPAPVHRGRAGRWVWDSQPRREIIAAARTRDQGRIIWDFVAGFAESLPLEIQRHLIYRRAPRLEIEFQGDGGGHVLRVIAADGKSALGGAPTMAILDERGHWALDRGDELEHALLSGLGKRGGRAFLISTSAADDTHPFSKWIDEPSPNSYVQEHRPAPGLPADDAESLLIANPGAEHGIGADLDWLKAQAKRAIARGGSSLTSASGSTTAMSACPARAATC